MSGSEKWGTGKGRRIQGRHGRLGPLSGVRIRFIILIIKGYLVSVLSDVLGCSELNEVIQNFNKCLNAQSLFHYQEMDVNIYSL